MKVLLVDNYDSFTHNLYQAMAGLGAEVHVRRNDAICMSDVEALAPSHVVLSPGPGRPDRARDFGICRQLVLEGPPARPLLGVCLGHQGIAAHLGGRIVRAPTIMHGKSSVIEHDGEGLFLGLPPRFEAMRYHSLTVDPSCVPDCLRITARTPDGVIMGLRHLSRPMFGIQFHPESIGTPLGPRLLARFLEVS